MRLANPLLAAALAVSLLSPFLPAADDPATMPLIQKASSAEENARLEARAEAVRLGAAAVAPLVGLMAGREQVAFKDEAHRREVPRAARAALEKLVHHAARPNAGPEREEVAAAIARALEGDLPDGVRRELLNLVGFIGGDAAVPAVAKLLRASDSHVREVARLALERIPGKAAVTALVDAAGKAGDDLKPDLFFSLGKKGDRSVVPFLAGVAETGGGAARLAALGAIARLEAPEGGRIFAALLAAKDLPDRGPIFNEYLRWADGMARTGKEKEANEAYARCLKESPLDHQRERALRQVARAAGDQVAVLVAALADPGERTREGALRGLLDLPGPESLGIIVKAYGEAGPAAKPALLRAIAGKDAAAAKPLLEEAAASGGEELKITALDLKDDLARPELEETYLAAARDGAGAVRPAALKGYLLLAQKKLDAGRKDEAYAMYSKALDLAQSDNQRVEAFRGAVVAGGTKAVDRALALITDPVLGGEASRQLLSLAAQIGQKAVESGDQGEKDRAEKLLTGLATGEFSADTRKKAVAELQKLGRDPQEPLRAKGFVLDWWLIGAMQDPDGKALETKFFPEEAIDLGKEHSIGPRRFRWKKPDGISLDGVIRLNPEFRRSDKVVGYAYAEVHSPAEQEAVFRIGSDDGCALFLNGRRLHLNGGERGLKVDEDAVPVKLAAGKNQVLLKIRNVDGEWSFAFRVTDAAGKPLDLSSPEAGRRGKL